MRQPLRILLWTIIAVALTLIACGGYAAWLIERQGLPDDFWQSFTTAKVRFDAHHIPTIEGPDWPTVIEAQGYVVASERLFQMDLMRRKAGGRLAEWFGDAAFEHDSKNAAEDRLALARRDVELLPADERRVCDAYAKGVNRFIQEHPGRWGIEYAVLRAEPEPWGCADSLLVVLEMAEFLTSSSATDAKQAVWRRHLSPAWTAWMFPADHPWNRPLFGVPNGIQAPPAAEYLPMQPIAAVEQAASHRQFEHVVAVGSNNWAYSGKNGVFLANDPHLGNNVPSVWYAHRLKVARDDWVVGTSIPGLPAVVIGMNPALAWAFTNTGEDVDDLLRETISPDGARYAARLDQGETVWEPIRREVFEVKVRGEPQPRQVEAMFTRRGPLVARADVGEGLYSRQWLPLKEGMLRLPMYGFLGARTVEGLQTAIDSMRAPAQNVVFATHAGEIGYRVSGTGIVRAATGLEIQDALAGEWRGFEPAENRRRLLMPAEAASHALATANERIWVDRFGHQWWHEDRKERIMRYLSARDDYARADMEALQLDTQSRFRSELLRWVASNAKAGDDAARRLTEAWQKWDGSSRTDPIVFAQADAIEGHLVDLVVGRVKQAFLADQAEAAVYACGAQRAWIVAAMAAKNGFAPFGLDDGELATYLLERVRRESVAPHQQTNVWKGQHPFVGRLQLIGRLFAINEREQWGAADVVDAEQPKHGPSMRMVWDMTRPWESTWTFPIGQSGHVRSAHYADMQRDWFDGKPYPVFDDPSQWEFEGRPQRPSL